MGACFRNERQSCLISRALFWNRFGIYYSAMMSLKSLSIQMVRSGWKLPVMPLCDLRIRPLIAALPSIWPSLLLVMQKPAFLKKNPLVSGKVEYAGRPLRVQVAVPPAIDKGASITIRLFASGNIEDYAPTYLFGKAVSLDTLRAEKMKNIAELAENDLEGALRTLVESRLNILISGGTSTGKTTFARRLLTHVDDGERLITIEDAFELFPAQPNTVALLAERASGSQRTANALLQASLRMRPDRIIVGELRGAEALTYLEAINTGHGGSVSTIHAETAELAIDRLAIMVLQAGTPLTFAEVREYIRKSIDVIVQLGRVDGKRGITEFYLPGR